jgi:type VI secretion system protein ImpA
MVGGRNLHGKSGLGVPNRDASRKINITGPRANPRADDLRTGSNMGIPPVLNVEEFLEPIAADRPAGANLAYEPEFDTLRAARRSDDDSPQGDWQKQTKSAEWDRVIRLGGDLLRTRTKDLQIAAWVTEALARVHGFAGLRDGLRLLLAIQDRFWDSFHPEIDDGDLESRFGPYVFLDTVLPLVIRGTPLTAGYAETPYSYLRWEESRATDNAGLKNPDLMDALIAEGKITGKQFDEQVAQTPRRFYEELSETLTECLTAYQEFDRSIDAHFGRDAPGLINVRKALEDCRRPLEPILRAKRAEEPDDEWGIAAAPAVEGVPADDEPADDATAVVEDRAPARRKRAAPRSAGGPIGSVEDAVQRIAEAATYLRAQDPTSAVSYLVTRALRTGELFGSGRVADAEAPASEVRQNLRRLASEGSWAELLEESELALGRPEGRAWLDPHRYSARALRELDDADRSGPASAVVAYLKTIVAEFPDLADAELSDGTPAANTETRAWVRDEVAPALAAPEAAEPPRWEPPAYEPEPSPAGATDDAPPDPWDLALAAVRSGRVSEGFERLRKALKSAETGRDRFLRKLQMAELCLMAGNPRLALPLAEDLAKQVDEFRLEEWEDERLNARVWAALYRCLKDASGDGSLADRAGEAFARLCRLDVGQALGFADGRPPG